MQCLLSVIHCSSSNWHGRLVSLAYRHQRPDTCFLKTASSKNYLLQPHTMLTLLQYSLPHAIQNPDSHLLTRCIPIAKRLLTQKPIRLKVQLAPMLQAILRYKYFPRQRKRENRRDKIVTRPSKLSKAQGREKELDPRYHWCLEIDTVLMEPV